jgi:hypothetical protein
MNIATLIKTTSETETVSPIDGKHFSLEELQKFVGGYIEFISLNGNGLMMVVNEEGKLKNLQVNQIATDTYKGGDIILGDVLICDKKLLK